MAVDMDITMAEATSLVRLLHLVSPTLPTGAYSYSQGLEWAVETGWITDKQSLGNWLIQVSEQSLGRVDIPILARMYAAVRDGDPQLLGHWCDLLLACRETSELRDEERTRGRALATLLAQLDLPGRQPFADLLPSCQLAGFAFAAASWEILLGDAATGYAWAWLENQVLTGMKIIPLGQSEGQRLLLELPPKILQNIKSGLDLDDGEIGGSSPALAITSSLHETQYTRLYRS